MTDELIAPKGPPMDDNLPELLRVGGVLAPEVRQLADSIGLLEVVGDAFSPVSDRLRVRRAERLAVLLSEAAQRLRDKGVSPVAVSDKLLRSILEDASVEDDPGLQERWVCLLETAASGHTVPVAFLEILRQLEPQEGRFLERVDKVDQRHLPLAWPALDELPEFAGQISWANLDNLERLGLISWHNDGPVNVPLPDDPYERSMEVRLLVTALGRRFLAICSAPPSQKSH